ncbi:hypothetical protein K8Z61_00165 [Nocardioides sp. TRM66260-LWL]|uniref:hypothetical protein n=1 Tax=Nocardioides sp. TRM66260-LWL TaxID=2874478 RepID=UPI001CC4295F|nr:hypothetical protein [Nocardioides sp. TRM66260-LWL]MBZ5732901.1 hypothetical protein [Nocardioides sp. TRM66260-LWL]
MKSRSNQTIHRAVDEPRVVARLLAAVLAVGSTILVRLRARDDRGDVPGWVLVTVMTVALVGAISKAAGPALTSMLTDALDSVR